jgi:hypothetical protein
LSVAHRLDASGYSEARRAASGGPRHLAALAACALVQAASALAAPVEVRLEWPQGQPVGPGPTIRVEAVLRAARGPVPVPQAVSVSSAPGGTRLDLAAGVWTLTASSPGFWSEPLDVDVGSQPTASAHLALWPSAVLRGEFVAFDGAEPLALFDLHLRPSGAIAQATSTGGVVPRELVVRCPVADGRWACLVPAGTFDLALRPEGRVPYYAWDLRLMAGSEERVGAIVLRRESSVAGRIRRADGSVPEGPCTATIRIAPARRQTPLGTTQTRGEMTFAGTPDRRGFFQVIGVTPGEHDLSVECLGASCSMSVSVRPDTETLLEDPLILDEVTLDVAVSPRLDPSRRPWRLNVQATAPRWRLIADAARVSSEGRWSTRGLVPGSYRVEVASEDGTLWAQRSLELTRRSGLVVIETPLMALSGRVQLATRPLSARLEFVSGDGGEPVRVESREDGLFDAYLPAPRSSTPQRWTVEVHSLAPPVNRRIEDVVIRASPGEAAAWLELTLPVVAVRGTVLSEDGDAQRGAVVMAENVATASNIVITTDGDGSFEFVSLPEGSYRVVAEAPTGSSEPATVDVADGVEEDLRLVLRRATRFVGQVTSDEGPVADAGIQIWLPPGVPRTFVRTDAQGRFETSLPPDTSDVALTVIAPGLPIKMTRESFGDGEPITVPLGSAAGSLILAVPADTGAQAPDSASLYVARSGAVESLGTLATWARLDGGGERGNEVVIPRLEPGIYALCRLGPQDVPALWGGAVTRERCAQGEVVAGRTLRLASP